MMTTSTAAWRSWLSKEPGGRRTGREGGWAGGRKHGGPSGGRTGLMIVCAAGSPTPEWEHGLLQALT